MVEINTKKLVEISATFSVHRLDKNTVLKFLKENLPISDSNFLMLGDGRCPAMLKKYTLSIDEYNPTVRQDETYITLTITGTQAEEVVR